MEDYSNIIKRIKKMPSVAPPSWLVEQVMNKVESIEIPSRASIINFHAMRENIQNKREGFLGKVITYRQCAFLLSLIGLFYLITGSVVMWGLHNTIEWKHLDFWLNMQPYLTILSAMIILASAFGVTWQPRLIKLTQFILILHTLLIVINAVVLKSMLSFPPAIMYLAILTMVALIFSILMIAVTHSVMKYNQIDKEAAYVESI